MIATGCARNPKPNTWYERVDDSPARVGPSGPTAEQIAAEFCAKGNLVVDDSTRKTGHVVWPGRGRWIKFQCVEKRDFEAERFAYYGRLYATAEPVLTALGITREWYFFLIPKLPELIAWPAYVSPAPDLAGTEWTGVPPEKGLTVRLMAGGVLEVKHESGTPGVARGSWKQKDNKLRLIYGHAMIRREAFATFDGTSTIRATVYVSHESATPGSVLGRDVWTLRRN